MTPVSPCLEPTCDRWARYRGRCEEHAPSRERETHRHESRAPVDNRPLIVIAGRSGTGKTAVLEALTSELDMRGIGIDSCPGGWHELLSIIDREEIEIVECVRIPRSLLARIRIRPSLVVVLEASTSTIANRLLERGESYEVAQARATQAWALGYERGMAPDDAIADHVIDADRDLEHVVAELLPLLSGWVPTTTRTTPRRIYSLKRWRILRKRKLAADPVCAICDQALATEVDHVVPIEEGGEAWTWGNLQSLCARCHGRKTAQEVRAREYA